MKPYDGISFPEPTTWNGDDPRHPSVARIPEDIAERDWWELESEARAFADRYGKGALLRCIARVVE